MRKILANCELRSVADANTLFESISDVLADASVDTIVVILDLSFPDTKTGLETLNRLRRNKDPRVRQIPVFMYSISRDPSDVAAAQIRGANGYYHKVKHPMAFWRALTTIDGSHGIGYWPKPRTDEDVMEKKRPSNDLGPRQMIQ
jgi:DNA-binding NarL/FixJ family response regulator